MGGQEEGTPWHAFLSTSPLRTGHGNTDVHRIGYRHRQQSVVSASADACCPSDSSRSKPHSLPNNTPRKNEQAPLRQSLPTSFASFLGHALLCSSLVSKDRLAPCTGPNSSFRWPRPRQAAADQPSRFNAADTRPCLPVQCVPSMRRQGGIYGLCGLPTILRTSTALSCTTPRALFSSPDLGRYRSLTYPCPWRGGQPV